MKTKWIKILALLWLIICLLAFMSCSPNDYTFGSYNYSRKYNELEGLKQEQGTISLEKRSVSLNGNEQATGKPKCMAGKCTWTGRKFLLQLNERGNRIETLIRPRYPKEQPRPINIYLLEN